MTHCWVHRSTEQGHTWTETGPVFADPNCHFAGDQYPPPIASRHDRRSSAS